MAVASSGLIRLRKRRGEPSPADSRESADPFRLFDPFRGRSDPSQSLSRRHPSLTNEWSPRRAAVFSRPEASSSLLERRGRSHGAATLPCRDRAFPVLFEAGYLSWKCSTQQPEPSNNLVSAAWSERRLLGGSPANRKQVRRAFLPLHAICRSSLLSKAQSNSRSWTAGTALGFWPRNCRKRETPSRVIDPTSGRPPRKTEGIAAEGRKRGPSRSRPEAQQGKPPRVPQPGVGGATALG